MAEDRSNKKLFLFTSILSVILGCFYFLYIPVFTSRLSSNLEFVIVVTRHGSRAPLYFYSNDPYKDPEYWPEGSGGLTAKGKLQMYRRGQNLKQRYYSLFQGKYDQKTIYIRSTQSARTYMSAAVLLAGMFPPTKEELWHPDINWQPIPIWPDYLDKTMIVVNDTLCPRFTKEQEKYMPVIHNYFNEHRDLFDYVKNYSGLPDDNLIAFGKVYDSLSCEHSEDIPLPAWTKSVYPDKINNAGSFIQEALVTGFGNNTMNRLFAGPLLDDFNSWIVRKIRGAVTEKMLVHSGHDFTLRGLMSAFGIIGVQHVEPSASLMIEVHQSSVGHKVKVFYSNHSSMEEPLFMNMPKCPEPCRLEKFLEVLKKLKVDDWHKECNSLE